MVKLYTDDGLLDMYPDEGIILKRVIFQASGLENNNSNFTKEFKIPATAQNSYLLKHYDVKNNSNPLSPHDSIPARVLVDNAFNIVGKLEILSVSYKYGKPNNYSVIFYSNVSSLKSEIGNDLLTDVDFDTDFQFTWAGGATVAYSWVGSIASGNIYIPIISWKRWFRWYSTPSGHADDISVSATGITLDELRVGMGVKPFLQAILTEYGYDLTFSGTVDSMFEEAYLFPVKYEDKDSDAVEYKLITQNTDAQSITITDSLIVLDEKIIDVKGLWTSNIYTATFGGTYSFDFSYTINVVAGSEVDVFVNIVDADTLANLGGATIYSGSTSTGGTVVISVILTATQRFKLEWVDNNGANLYTAIFAKLESTSVPFSPIGLDFDPSVIMPEMRVTDFLSQFLKTYNLVLDKTSKDSFILTDYDTLYATTEILDITTIVNNMELTYEKLDVYNTVNLKYRESKDAPNVAFKEVSERNFGEYNYRPDLEYSDGEFKRDSIFTVFPPVYMDSYNGSDIKDGATDLQHHFQLTNETPYKPAEAQFLMLYKNNIIFTNYPYYLQNGIATMALLNTYSQYSQVKDSESTTNSYTLTYYDENPFVGSIAEKNIFNVLYNSWFSDIYSDKAYKVKVTIPANLSTYLKVKDLIVIYLNGQYHFIMEYSYNTNKELLTLLLMRIRKYPQESISGDYNIDYNIDYLT